MITTNNLCFVLLYYFTLAFCLDKDFASQSCELDQKEIEIRNKIERLTVRLPF